MTADEYMREAVTRIDAQFGKGFAQANPQLVGQFVMASAIDFGASIIAKTIGEFSETVRDKAFHDG